MMNNITVDMTDAEEFKWANEVTAERLRKKEGDRQARIRRNEDKNKRESKKT